MWLRKRWILFVYRVLGIFLSRHKWYLLHHFLHHFLHLLVSKRLKDRWSRCFLAGRRSSPDFAGSFLATEECDGLFGDCCFVTDAGFVDSPVADGCPVEVLGLCFSMTVRSPVRILTLSCLIFNCFSLALCIILCAGVKGVLATLVGFGPKVDFRDTEGRSSGGARLGARAGRSGAMIVVRLLEVGGVVEMLVQ